MRICSNHRSSHRLPFFGCGFFSEPLFFLDAYNLHLAGLSSSAPIACGGGSVSDLFSERDRASAMALYSLGPLIGMYTVQRDNLERFNIFIVGPVVGPVAGGFIAQTIGVKWVFIIIASKISTLGQLICILRLPSQLWCRRSNRYSSSAGNLRASHSPTACSKVRRSRESSQGPSSFTSRAR